MTTRFISESELLRLANLPSTQKWRAFLRERLGGEQAGGTVVYERLQAELVAAQIADFAAEVIPATDHTEAEPSPSRASRSGKLLNRIV